MANQAGLKTLKAYTIGFIVSLALTLLTFYVVYMHMDPVNVKQHLFTAQGLIWVLMALAVLQLFVQATCFLRLNASKEGRWELMPFLFIIFIVLIFVFGSLWIMANLNANMM